MAIWTGYALMRRSDNRLLMMPMKNIIEARDCVDKMWNLMDTSTRLDYWEKGRLTDPDIYRKP